MSAYVGDGSPAWAEDAIEHFGFIGQFFGPTLIEDTAAGAYDAPS